MHHLRSLIASVGRLPGRHATARRLATRRGAARRVTAGRHRPGPPTARRLACWVMLIVAGAPAWAQSPPPRPRIGLALGGGSARGFAHIGVLQWFDEHRIPIDVIGGTSMGGLIGGSFATGMTPAEIQQLIDSLNWSQVLSPDTPFVYKTFRRKEDTRAFPSQLRMGLKGGLKLPGGLSPGEQVELLFDRIAAPYGSAIAFNDLPTPFRCVATDLRTSKAVVFDSGWLARALRSTMAIPGVFSPVEFDGQVLVDGGVVNNVPADIVKETGLADVVIAVDVGADLTYERGSDTLFGVLGETLDVMMRGGANRALESASLVLIPNLKGFSGSDFSRGEEFVKQGYAAAEARKAELLRFAVSEPDYAAWVSGRQARRRTELPAPAFITVDGVSPAEASLIQRRLWAHIGQPLDTARLDRDLTLLTGAGRYDTAAYRFDHDGGRPGLVIIVKRKAHGPPFLLLGLDLQNTQTFNVTATVRSRLVLFDVLGRGSEGRVDVSLGSTLGAAAEIYRPLGRTGLFLAPRAFAERKDMPVFSDGNYLAEYRTQHAGGAFDVGFSTERRLETRVGFTVDDLSAERRIGAETLGNMSGTQQYVSARVVYDGQTGPTIPERGAYLEAEARRFFKTARIDTLDGAVAADPDDLWSADAYVSWYHPVGKHGRFFLRGTGGSSFGDTTMVNAFTLGGPFNLGALHTDELRGSNFALANVGYFHELARMAEGALGRLYFGMWLDEGAVFERWNEAAFQTNLSAGFILESPLGPVFAAGSVGRDGRYRVYVGLGPVLKR